MTKDSVFTPAKAALELVHQSWNERARYRRDYLRCVKALQALGVDEAGQAEVLRELNYIDGFGKLRDRYLTKTKAREAKA